ncbi:hypothetical protein MGALJ_33770 [Mycobacterium gallinarum]|uniref:Uncharacterized protein n=1 Tax=Mycobacterium gallinarum TaxID=39689 RepID=A0A9W4BBG5_9MYCO|nr:hypothetical protein [Mycobacterium gallinarum]BBY93708.1 hypothetical protein MGALJ_33770 [Mycobacterium gallinarum]
MRWLFAVVAGMLIVISAIAPSPANAQPVPPPPPPTQPGSSSTDELADMVLDAIEHDSVAAPTTTPVPQP